MVEIMAHIHQVQVINVIQSHLSENQVQHPNPKKEAFLAVYLDVKRKNNGKSSSKKK
jgi:hypothetical protein